MNSRTFETELEVWQADGYSIRIFYSPGVLDEVGIAATEGFNRLPHGGVEIGGVLFGVPEPDRVQVLGQKVLACEHALGPSFTLSDNDRRGLQDLLHAPQTDPELAGLQPVGCYISHNRSELMLAERDLQLYEQYFSQAWQVALVLRPHRFDPVRAGFFFREPDGSVHASGSRHEFIIQPRALRTAPSARAMKEPAPLEPAPRMPAIARESLSEPKVQTVRLPAASAYRRKRRPWTAAAGAVAAAGLLFWMGSSRGAPPLSLRALDVGGQLRIDWNCKPGIVQQSESADLSIEDGRQKVLVRLSREQLRAGSLTYARLTGNVLAYLTVQRTDRSKFTQTVRFLGLPVTTAVAMNTGTAERSAAPQPNKPDIKPAELPPVRTAAAPAKEKPRQRAQAEMARSRRVVSVQARRQLELPAAAVRSDADSLMPGPSVSVSPEIPANVAVAWTPVIPRLPAPAPPPAPPKRTDRTLQTGTMIWTGRLGRGQVIQISGNHASFGHLTGALPGEPVRVRVFPGELTHDGLRIFTADPKWDSAPEAPGAQNGWNRTVYVLNPRQATDIHVLEAPEQRNTWKRMTLRAARADHAIIVVRWERVPGSE